MSSPVLWSLVAVQVALGAFDVLYHHELTERLAWRRSQRRELVLHGVRNVIYAVLFVYPSLHEGFGLPVLEAMARGLPVASSDRSSLPEVAGDAAVLFDPEDVGAMRAAIERLLGDPAERERLSRLGREQAARFTWEACARATLATYERTLSEPA